MPSPIAHAAAGYAFFRMFGGSELRGRTTSSRLLLGAAVGFSLLPDIDLLAAIALPLGRALHGTATHSIVVAMLVAAAVAGLARWWDRHNVGRWFWLALFCCCSHALMDTMTLGRGVMLLWPLSTTRFLSPVKLFYGLHWSEGLFSWSHVITLVTELAFAAAVVSAVHSGRPMKWVSGSSGPRQDQV